MEQYGFTRLKSTTKHRNSINYLAVIYGFVQPFYEEKKMILKDWFRLIFAKIFRKRTILFSKKDNWKEGIFGSYLNIIYTKLIYTI